VNLVGRGESGADRGESEVGGVGSRGVGGEKKDVGRDGGEGGLGSGVWGGVRRGGERWEDGGGGKGK